MAIWKYELQPFSNVIPMPKGAVILSTAFQGEDLKIWAQVDPEQSPVPRKFFVYGTGWMKGQEGKFIGTAFHPGDLVFHVFDQGEE